MEKSSVDKSDVIRFARFPEKERCQETLKAELGDVLAPAPSRYGDYIAQKRRFFNALVTFYEQPQQEEAVTPQFRQGISTARNYI